MVQERPPQYPNLIVKHESRLFIKMWFASVSNECSESNQVSDDCEDEGSDQVSQKNAGDYDRDPDLAYDV